MYKLTIPQQNIWNLQKYYEITSISNVCGAVFYDCKYDDNLLAEAINKEIELQSGLRLRFCEENGEPLQYVSECTHVDIPFVRFNTRKEFDAFADSYAKKPIGLIENQMHQFTVFEVEGKSGVLVAASHLVSDAWTFSIFAREVTLFYGLLAGGREISCDVRDYRDYMESEQKYLLSARYNKDKIYWENKYSVEKPEPSLIKYSSKPVSVPVSKRYSRNISESDTIMIDEWCAENAISQAVLFETAFFAYLAKINPESKNITIGIPVLNRTNTREKETVGMFVSTTPLSIEVSIEDTVISFCRKLTSEHMALFRHQKYPYDHILRYVREKYGCSGNMYDVMISYQNAKTDTGFKTKWYSNGYSEVPFAFHIDNRDSAESYTMTIDYQTEIFRQPEEIELIAERILFIIRQMTEKSDIKICELNILPSAEYQKVIYDFNDTYADYPKDKCVHELFSEQVRKTPDKVALVFEDRNFTYKQLDEMSNSVAHYLREEIGIEPNDIVPLIAERNWCIIVAMLGILKAGGAYMPVNPSFPSDRIKHMLKAAEPKVIFLHTANKANFSEFKMVDLDIFDYSKNITPIKNINIPDNLSYVIFTSGSTGEPKGVCLKHICLTNLICWQMRDVNIGLINNIMGQVIITFDVSVQEIVFSLLSGKCLFLVKEGIKENLNLFLDFIDRHHIDTLFVTPSYFSVLQSKDKKSILNKLNVIFFAGEKLELTDRIFEKYPHVSMYNQYGPAETAVISSSEKIRNTEITIGKPISNSQMYILDKNKTPLPIGVAGELCLSGDGVGEGYLNFPEMTAEKFIADPFIDGKTMYCTGDLARWRYDGEIEYLGRIDTQVKIRGLRIELSEIEIAMGSFPGIGMTAVSDKRDDSGRQYLVGYYTSDSVIDETALRALLSSKLPQYMVPNYFMKLDEMPMTTSGKTDRKNLPVPLFKLYDSEYAAPETDEEKILCDLLGECVSIDKVGIDDDFFKIGVDSLTAIEYVTKAHNKGIEFTLQNIFDAPTVRKLCKLIADKNRKHIQYSANEFDKYSKILERNVNSDNLVISKHFIGNVLLTGATGFLGAHILDELMRSETGKIYCLVRGTSSENCREKLCEILHCYFDDKYDSEIGKRIQPVVGDVTNENLSDYLPGDIHTVIHTAAAVKHYGSYDYFDSVNVIGTKNVVDYAKKSGAKLIHISTLSVSGNSFDGLDMNPSSGKKYFYEHSLYIGQPLDNVYAHSKFEAELKVLDAMLEGLDAKIIRIGFLTNRMSDSKFQPNYESNAFLMRFKAFLELGAFPEYLLPLYAEFSPVDLAAEAIVKIAQYADRPCIFHLNNNKSIHFNELLEYFNKLGIKINVLESSVFSEILKKVTLSSDTEHIYKAFKNDMDKNGKIIYDRNIYVINDFTVDFLRKVGFEWKQIDFEYVKNYIEYFKNIGYFDI